MAGDRRAEAGITLIELMLLITACTVLIGSLLSGIVSLNAQRQLREERLLALVACRNVLEDLRRDDIDAVRAEHGRGFAIAGVTGTGVGLAPVNGDADGLPGSISVTVERAYGTEVLYRVIAAVDWQRGTGRGHLHLSTLMARRR